MKKIITILSVVMVLFLALSYAPEAVKAIGNIIRSGANVPDGSLKMRTSNATNTPVFLQTGIGTTSLTFASEEFSTLTAYVQVFASTTGTSGNTPTLFIERFASDNNVDFFAYLDDYGLDELDMFGSTTISVASSTIPVKWTPGVQGATSTAAINMRLIPAKYTRLSFYTATGTPMLTTFRDGMNLFVNAVGQSNSNK